MKPFLIFTFFCVAVVSNGQCDSITMTLSGTNPTCYNFSDGSVNVSQSGANGFPTFVMTDSVGTVLNTGGGIGNNLSGGWYYVEMTDDSGCVVLDSIFLVNPPEMQAQISYTDPTHLDSCNGIAEVDTVLNYQGNYGNIGYYWNPGGPTGIGETIKDDLCNDFYTLVINDEWGCSIYVDFASGSASFDDFQVPKQIIFYPNPVQNELYLSMPAIKTHYEIYYTNGQLILSGVVENGNIDLTNLGSGQYVLKIISDTHEYSSIIVKE